MSLTLRNVFIFQGTFLNNSWLISKTPKKLLQHLQVFQRLNFKV